MATHALPANSPAAGAGTGDAAQLRARHAAANDAPNPFAQCLNAILHPAAKPAAATAPSSAAASPAQQVRAFDESLHAAPAVSDVAEAAAPSVTGQGADAHSSVDRQSGAPVRPADQNHAAAPGTADGITPAQAPATPPAQVTVLAALLQAADSAMPSAAPPANATTPTGKISADDRSRTPPANASASASASATASAPAAAADAAAAALLPADPAPAAGTSDAAPADGDATAKPLQTDGGASSLLQALEHAFHAPSPAPVTEAKTLTQPPAAATAQNHTGPQADTSGGQSGTGGSGGSHAQSADKPATAVDGGAQTGPSYAHEQTAVAPQPAPAALQAPGTIAGFAAPASPSQPAGAVQIAPQAATDGSSPLPDLHGLAVSIAAQSQAGLRQFDIRLDPAELGRVDVRLTVDSAGRAQAHLAVDKPQTLELLQRDQGNLARALRESGVQLGGSGLQFSLKGQDRQGESMPRAPSRARSLAITAAAPGADAPLQGIRMSTTGIDIRV
jgi:flagellar hook-length control protein FliK